MSALSTEKVAAGTPVWERWDRDMSVASDERDGSVTGTSAAPTSSESGYRSFTRALPLPPAVTSSPPAPPPPPLAVEPARMGALEGLLQRQAEEMARMRAEIQLLVDHQRSEGTQSSDYDDDLPPPSYPVASGNAHSFNAPY